MSSDHYGSQAGEIADRQALAARAAKIERGFLLWVNELTRHEATLTHYEQLQAAFYAGFGLGEHPLGVIRTEGPELTEAEVRELTERFQP